MVRAISPTRLAAGSGGWARLGLAAPSSVPHNGPAPRLPSLRVARMSLLSPGDTAPDFTLSATDGSQVTLSDLRGQRVLLYFYPRDDTPGCTIEACGFRDNLDELAARGVDVYGINDNDVGSHQRFAGKYDLNFPLLADTEHGVIEAYGAWVQKEIRGQSVMCADRVSYLIDASGDVEHVWPAVDPNVHLDEIVARLDANA